MITSINGTFSTELVGLSVLEDVALDFLESPPRVYLSPTLSSARWLICTWLSELGFLRSLIDWYTAKET
jgi:hypothetical protein